MTHKLFLLVLLPFVFLLILAGLYFPRETKKAIPVRQVKQYYRQHTVALDSAVTQLRQAVAQNAQTTLIHQRFREARLAYKRVEYLLEYYNPYTAKHLNGPALDEVEFDDPLQRTIPPEGFQVIEEYLFPVYDRQQKQALLDEVSLLASNIRRLYYIFDATQFTDAHLFDAMRQEMFRIVTLGITGFDSPVATYSIPETAAALESLQNTISLYQPQLQGPHLPLSAALNNDFANSIRYLRQHSNFNAFDRAEFITRFANPLTARVKEVQQALQIPVGTELRAVSPDAANLFAENAFNVNYFAPDYNSHTTPERVKLGQVLFFDPVLSGNGNRSCASCHQPEKAFTDGQSKSIAFDFKGQVSRNAPTILNAGLQRSLFHDLRVAYLEDQASDVIASASEMHGDLQRAVNDLRTSPEYVELFRGAFPQAKNEPVTERHLKVAIAAYIRSLTALNSRFDQYMRGDATKLTFILYPFSTAPCRRIMTKRKAKFWAFPPQKIQPMRN